MKVRRREDGKVGFMPSIEKLKYGIRNGHG